MGAISNDNYLTGAMSNMLNGELSEQTVKNRKASFIEALILFLEIYGASEIGVTDINLLKVALWVDSPLFENVDIRKFRTTKEAFNYLTKQVIDNIPLYRFLNLNDSQIKILETSHIKELQDSMMCDAETYPCLKCIWFFVESTSLGTLRKCSRLDFSFRPYKSNHINPAKHKKCKYVKTINDSMDDVSMLPSYRQRDYICRFNQCRQIWIDKYNHLDNSTIPIYLDEDDVVSLIEEQNNEDQFLKLAKELGRAYRNKRSLKEIKESYRRAILFNCMIKFIDIYAETEIGNGFRCNIKKLVEFVYSDKATSLMSFTDEDSCFKLIEESILNNTLAVKSYVKRYNF